MPYRISSKQMAEQWATLPNKFEVNVCNFETVVGDKAEYIFKRSFYLGHFNSSGEYAWKERQRKRPYPILNETGQLKNSISWKRIPQSDTSRGVVIFTDPDKFRNLHHRNQGACYADVHNAESGSYTYGNTGVPSVQRQFIGHSTAIRDMLYKNKYKIFDGFPK